MRYEGVIYRPPSEAHSLIIQVTVGCKHNQCTFCTMYKDKRFHVRSREEIFEDFQMAKEYYGDGIRRIFLADGDALCLPTEDLLALLTEIYKVFPYVERVTSYGTARDVLNKSVQELTALRRAGLQMIYMGAESGDKQILKDIHKNVTREELIQAAKRLKHAGMLLSLTLISGLGGRERLEEHALGCASLVSAMQPEYLGFLTLMLDHSAPIYHRIERGELTLLKPEDILKEMQIFLQSVDASGTVFRANHASNYMILKGNLNEDIPRMLAQLEQVRENQKYRSEKARRL